MKEGFRQSMAWLHTWTGLVVGWVLFFVFLTGTCAYFDTEIDRWMQPERPMEDGRLDDSAAVAVALARLQTQAPDAERWTINPRNGRTEPDLRISWRMPAAEGQRASTTTELLDSTTGAPGAWRETGGGQLLYKMHYRLHYFKQRTGYWIVGICSMCMLVAILTGIVTHKKIFRDFFTFRPRKGQRSWLDAHNLVGVAALPFHLMITYSGLVFYMTVFMPMIVSATYGFGDENNRTYRSQVSSSVREVAAAGMDAPLAPLQPMIDIAKQRWDGANLRSVVIEHPGDANARVIVGRSRSLQSGTEQMIFDGVSGVLLDPAGPVRHSPRKVHDTFLGLHEALFAGPLLRWLFFLSGVLGTVMVGTGLVLWTAKRRPQVASGRRVQGMALVERLNVGTIVGLPIAILVYFWANRLIPAGLPGRGPWEAHAMFAAWALTLVYCWLRPVSRAWVELLSLAAALGVLLPVLNWLTTDRHLGVTLPRGGHAGDWGLAGFDLTLFAFGLAFATTALVLAGRRSGKLASEAAASGNPGLQTTPT